MSLPNERPIWRPYTQEQTAPPPTEIVSAKGAYLHAKSGQRIFDGISSWWLITHGHCHPEIVEAIRRQAARLDQVTFANFTHASAEELAALLIQVTPPELTRVFFTDNGSTAVEAGLKMTLQAYAQKGDLKRQKFLAFSSSYHGDTVGAMSVSGDSPFNRPYKSALFEVIRAKHPMTSLASTDDYVRDFERLMEEHHPTLAGVIVEPLIQGAGGMIAWPDEAVKRIAEICQSLGVYLIFDEVMTGFGRTGQMFAMSRLNVTPDIICLSKGLTGGTLPLAVTIAREDIYAAFLSQEKSRMFFHGHSFTGNPISCSAAVANMKVFLRKDTQLRIDSVAAAQADSVDRLKNELQSVEIRTCGTMAALEFQNGENGYLTDSIRWVAQFALENGLFIRPLGNVVYLLPPYCSSAQEIQNAWDIIIFAAKKMCRHHCKTQKT